MRTVYMDKSVAPTQRGDALTSRLGGHLWARLMELEPCGMTVVEGEEDARKTGVVAINWHKGSNEEMVRRLAQDYHIYASQNEQGDAVTFSTGTASFEDIDYVQGAVWEVIM